MHPFKAASAIALAFAGLSTQHRPLRLILGGPDRSGMPDLLPQRIFGTEAMFDGIDLRILCVSESASLPLKSVIGVPAELQVVTDRGGLRRLCGIVTHAASGQSDGGLAAYELRMRDAFSVMENKRNTRVFRDKNELDIIQIIVREWQQRIGMLAGTFQLSIDSILEMRKLPRRQFVMQHGESDADFLRRLMQQRGIAWFFRAGIASPNGASAAHEARIGHTLVLFDDSARLAQNAVGQVRFHRDDATEEADTITAWSGVRELGAGAVSLYSWDYRRPGDQGFLTEQATSRVNQGVSGNHLAAGLEDYQVAAPHVADNLEDMARLAATQIEQHDYAGKWFAGEGSVRDLAVGEWFTLAGHPEIDTHPVEQRQFIVTAQQIRAQNNLPLELGGQVERLFERSGWSFPEDRPRQGATARISTVFDGRSVSFLHRRPCRVPNCSRRSWWDLRKTWSGATSSAG